jgi:hypothetical protein
MGRGVTGQEPREYYRPSNQRQADVMDTADKVLFIASFATGKGVPGTIMAEARTTTVVTTKATVRNPREVRRFMSGQELKTAKKEGLLYNPEIGSGIPTTTTNFKPRNQSHAKRKTGARSAQYQVDYNVTGLRQGPTRKTKGGLPEYPIGCGSFRTTGV